MNVHPHPNNNSNRARVLPQNGRNTNKMSALHSGRTWLGTDDSAVALQMLNCLAREAWPSVVVSRSPTAAWPSTYMGSRYRGPNTTHTQANTSHFYGETMVD